MKPLYSIYVSIICIKSTISQNKIGYCWKQHFACTKINNCIYFTMVEHASHLLNMQKIIKWMDISVVYIYHQLLQKNKSTTKKKILKSSHLLHWVLKNRSVM